MSADRSVLIIGAGIAGLLAARALVARGRAVTVLDKGRGVGGRLATRRLGAAAFDTGAQFFTVRDPRFAALVDGWRAAGLVEVWSGGFATWDAERGWRHEPDGHLRYRVVGGMTRLAKHLAAGLDVRLERAVSRLDGAAGRWSAVAAVGAAGEIHQADALVITAPVPQALALLAAGRQQRAMEPVAMTALSAVTYDPCLCLLVEWPGATATALADPGGVRIDGDGQPIQWLASQRAKGLRAADPRGGNPHADGSGGAGEGLIVHARAPWSAQRHGRDDDANRDELWAETRALLARLGPGLHGDPATGRRRRPSSSRNGATPTRASPPIAPPCAPMSARPWSSPATASMARRSKAPPCRVWRRRSCSRDAIILV